MKIDVKFNSNNHSMNPEFSNSIPMGDGGTNVTIGGEIQKTFAADEYVQEKISNDVVDGAPASLDTIGKLAKALDNDPNFATTIENLKNEVDEISVRVPKGGEKGQVLKKTSDEDYKTEWGDDIQGQNFRSDTHGYYYSYVDIVNQKIYITDTRVIPEIGTENRYDVNFPTPNYPVGGRLCLVNGTKYDWGSLGADATIVAIKNNEITYTGSLGTEFADGISSALTVPDQYTLFVLEAPEVGPVIVKHDGVSFNSTSIAYGEYAVAEGISTKAIGNYSHTEGNETVAYYSGHAEGHMTKAEGHGSHTEGRETQTTSNAVYAHAEGCYSKASGNGSHAEGWRGEASGQGSHAEGYASSGNTNLASASGSHAEGYNTKAKATAAHAEGRETIAGDRSDPEMASGNTGEGSHAEGLSTKALGTASHAEGKQTKALNEGSHAEGVESVASNKGTHSEGYRTIASGLGAHAEGYAISGLNIIASGMGAHAEGVADGQDVTASGVASHAEGYITSAVGFGSHAEGASAKAGGRAAHAEGEGVVAGDETDPEAPLVGSAPAKGNQAHAEGYQSKALGNISHAEGDRTKALGDSSHSEGKQTQAKNTGSHAEGVRTQATGYAAHAEGYADGGKAVLASGEASHAEGRETTASGAFTHAEGLRTKAQGNSSHAEGEETVASGRAAHAEGRGTRASAEGQHVQGKYNDTTGSSQYAHIQGWGASDTDRKNIHTVSTTGVGWFKGGVVVGGTSQGDGKKLLTEEDISEIKGDLYGGLSKNLFDLAKLGDWYYSEGTAGPNENGGVSIYTSGGGAGTVHYGVNYDAGDLTPIPLTDFCDVQVGKTYTMSCVSEHGRLVLGVNPETGEGGVVVSPGAGKTFVMTQAIIDGGIMFECTGYEGRDEYGDYSCSIDQIMLVEGNEAAEYTPYGGTTIGALDKISKNTADIDILKAEIGDISAALDAIIAQQEAVIAEQNNLIGGGA